MKKTWVVYLVAVFLTASLLSFTGCGSSPSAPADPTPVPTVSVTGNLNLPGAQNGKAFKVSYYSSLSDLSNPVNSLSGTCGASATVPYSLTVSAGSYYITAVVDVDSNTFFFSPNAGDYLGVYGTTWPVWPGSKNAAVSSGSSSFDVNLVTASNNLSGTITIPADQAGKQYWVLVDQDTNGGNSNYAALQMGNLPSGTAIPFAVVVMVPGTYYLYGGVNMDSSGPPVTGDYIGFYGVSSPPYYNSPASPNLTIDVAASDVKNFSESIY